MEKVTREFMAEVKKHRKHLRDLSNRSGVPYTTMYNWVCDTSTPTVENATKVLKALGKTLTITDKE